MYTAVYTAVYNCAVVVYLSVPYAYRRSLYMYCRKLCTCNSTLTCPACICYPFSVDSAAEEMETVSGEMFFRSNSFSGTSESFSSYLLADVDAAAQKRDITGQLNFLRKSRMHMRRVLRNKLESAEMLTKTLSLKRYVFIVCS